MFPFAYRCGLADEVRHRSFKLSSSNCLHNLCIRPGCLVCKRSICRYRSSGCSITLIHFATTGSSTRKTESIMRERHSVSVHCVHLSQLSCVDHSGFGDVSGEQPWNNTNKSANIDTFNREFCMPIYTHQQIIHMLIEQIKPAPTCTKIESSTISRY